MVSRLEEEIGQEQLVQIAIPPNLLKWENKKSIGILEEELKNYISHLSYNN